MDGWLVGGMDVESVLSGADPYPTQPPNHPPTKQKHQTTTNTTNTTKSGKPPPKKSPHPPTQPPPPPPPNNKQQTPNTTTNDMQVTTRRVTQLGLVCGGTGITPMLQILRDILKVRAKKTNTNNKQQTQNGGFPSRRVSFVP
jgi:hypothetical protein